MRSLLPPRRKDAKPGKMQVGLFIRDTEGRIIEASVNEPTPSVEAAAWWLLHVTACKSGCAMCAQGRGKALRAYEVLDHNIERHNIERHNIEKQRKQRNPQRRGKQS